VEFSAPKHTLKYLCDGIIIYDVSKDWTNPHDAEKIFSVSRILWPNAYSYLSRYSLDGRILHIPIFISFLSRSWNRSPFCREWNLTQNFVKKCNSLLKTGLFYHLVSIMLAHSLLKYSLWNPWGTVTFPSMRVYLSNILSPIHLLFTQDIVHQYCFCLSNIPLTIQLLLKQHSFHQSSVLSSKNPLICPASTQPQILSSIQFLVNITRVFSGSGDL